MAKTRIEDLNTEKLYKSLKTIKWLLPLMVVTTILCLSAVLYDWFVNNQFEATGLAASFFACFFFSIYFYTQRKKILIELERREMK